MHGRVTRKSDLMLGGLSCGNAFLKVKSMHQWLIKIFSFTSRSGRFQPQDYTRLLVTVSSQWSDLLAGFIRDSRTFLPSLVFWIRQAVTKEERILKVTKKSGNRGRCRKLSL